MPSVQLTDGCKTPLQYCVDLQSLITITVEYVLTPLRKEVKKSSEYSEILNIEIQDAEVRVF